MELVAFIVLGPISVTNLANPETPSILPSMCLRLASTNIQRAKGNLPNRWTGRLQDTHNHTAEAGLERFGLAL